MDCQNCALPIEEGALFCGNCGQQVRYADSHISSVLKNESRHPHMSGTEYSSFGHLIMNGGAAAAAVPRYALTTYHNHNHVKIIFALVCSLIGIVGAFFIPLVGIALGSVALVLATLATHESGRALKISALILSVLAILAGLGVWVHLAATNPRLHPALAQTAASAAPAGNAVTSLRVTTPCYSVSFPVALNIYNAQGSCEMNAYNGASLAKSSNVYKVLSSSSTIVTESNFLTVTKKAVDNDIKQNLPGFLIQSEGLGSFAGSPAYYVNAANAQEGVAIEEGAVLHSSAAGTNLFVLVHVTFGKSTNLTPLEKSWVWK